MSVEPTAAAPLLPPGGDASPSLDSFFRRLSAGQGSRIWRPAAVPGTLRPSMGGQPQSVPEWEALDNGGQGAASGAGSTSRAPALSPARAAAAADNGAASAAATPASSSESSRPASLGASSRRSPPPPAPPAASSPLNYREQKFAELLQADVVKLDQLRQLSWNGVPRRYRPAVWQLLVGYLPANRDRREGALKRKRREYRESVPVYFDIPDGNRTSQEQDILRQILVDVPRTNPEVPFFHQDAVQRAMERILYIWAIRHPASGYVQGINDLVTPLYLVFLSAYVGDAAETADASRMDPVALEEVEADTYWCLTKLLDNIQDHYTAMQPGLQRMVLRLEDLVNRIDGDLYRHLQAEGLQFIQFAFRWMNCLLMRELPLRAIVRAWDTYLAEENGFGSFHIYVCAALLCRFSQRLQGLDFQGLVLFLQDLPTREWQEGDVEPLLSQAYILSTLFEHSPNHLAQA